MTASQKAPRGEDGPAILKAHADPPAGGKPAGKRPHSDWRKYRGLWREKALAPALRALVKDGEGLTASELGAALRRKNAYCRQVLNTLCGLGLAEVCGTRRAGAQNLDVFRLTDLGRRQVDWLDANPALARQPSPPEENDHA